MHSIASDVAKSIILLSTYLAWSILPVPTVADDWPSFRGPNHSGLSAETDWTSDWPEDGPPIAWRAKVGIGASSVAVVGNRLVTMGSDKEKNEEIVWCLDARTGETVWQFRYPAKFDARQFEGGPASTPTIHDKLVYALGYLGDVHCLDLETGQIVWRRHLVDDFGGRLSSWKYAGSPLVIDDLVIFDAGADGNSTVALHRTTGDKVWGAGNDLAGYSTPIPFQHAGVRGVLVFKARAMVAHDLAGGRELWRIDWRTTYDCNASSPTVLGDKLFISTGYGGRRARGALFQLGDGQPKQIWVNQNIETRMNSAVVFNDRVYCISELGSGQLMCVNLHDGTLVWSEQSFAKYGTLMIAGGKLIILDEKGDLVVADTSTDEFSELARAKVLGGRSWVMPVLANGRIFAKNNLGNIACIDVQPENAK